MIQKAMVLAVAFFFILNLRIVKLLNFEYI